jgi:hypothetical protein
MFTSGAFLYARTLDSSPYPPGKNAKSGLLFTP